MATFSYNAINAGGREVNGKIEADNEGAAVARLHEQNMRILSVSEDKGSAFSFGANKALGAPKGATLVVFSRQFATMVDAGLSVLKCLDILEAQTKDVPLKQAINVLRKDVKSGLSLGDALAKHPNCFNKLYVNMIRAAEIGGILDIILDRLAGFLEKDMDVRHKIKSAMMYPIIVLCFAIGMIFALFFFVLPKFKEIFSSMQVELPPMTKAIFTMSDFMVSKWYLFIIVPIVVFFAVKRYGATPEGRLRIDRMKLQAPLVGDITLKMAVSRLTRTFGTLLSSGVTMVRAMEIVGETAGNAVISKAITDSRNAIREGKRLSQPLQECGLFPLMVTQMIDIGEETGRLSEMMVRVADSYDAEVESTIKGLTSMIEPILMVFMGVVVGFIAISIFAPMFKLISSIA
jgi:type IV pilus assembly protein PilC